MLVFMSRDPGEATSKVLCCVEPSWCSKNSDFDAIVSLPLALLFKIILPENPTTVNLKSASFIVIMHLHKSLTHTESQIKPWLLFGESFALSVKMNANCRVKS